MTTNIYPIPVYDDPEKVTIGDIIWIRVRKELLPTTTWATVYTCINSPTSVSLSVYSDDRGFRYDDEEYRIFQTVVTEFTDQERGILDDHIKNAQMREVAIAMRVKDIELRIEREQKMFDKLFKTA